MVNKKLLAIFCLPAPVLLLSPGCVTHFYGNNSMQQVGIWPGEKKLIKKFGEININRTFTMNLKQAVIKPLFFYKQSSYKYDYMAIAKTAEFTKKEQDLAAFAKALGHPARVAILKVLAQKNECVCGQIVEVLPLAQSTVSQHLKALKDAGLITGSIEGTNSCYCINWKAFAAFKDEFNILFDKLKLKNDKACC